MPRCDVCGSTSATVLTCLRHGIKDCARCHQRMIRRLIDHWFKKESDA